MVPPHGREHLARLPMQELLGMHLCAVGSIPAQQEYDHLDKALRLGDPVVSSCMTALEGFQPGTTHMRLWTKSRQAHRCDLQRHCAKRSNSNTGTKD
jgi:hypothetical protein